MKIVLMLALLALPLYAHENTEEYGKAYAKKYSNAINTLDDLKSRTDEALDFAFKVAVVNLRDKGFYADADQIEFEWNTEWRGAIFTRDIGHIYLSSWLENTYDKIEKALGVETCKALHISIIKTVNCSLPVLFGGCSWDMTGVLESRRQDYIDHFAHGAVYKGLLPEVTWAGITVGCWAGTAGVGAFLCSIAASGAEWFAADIVGPPLGGKLYDAICGQ